MTSGPWAMQDWSSVTSGICSLFPSSITLSCSICRAIRFPCLKIERESSPCRKMVTITLYARQQKRNRCIEQSFGLCGRGRGGMIWENGIDTCKLWFVKWIASPGSMHDTGCSGLVHWDDPEGRDGEGGGSGGSGWGTHVHPWEIQANVWQNQYNVVK